MWPVLSVAGQVLAAYILVDFLTGLYHLATDKGWNIEQQRRLFEIHHQTNAMDGFDWQPMVMAVPALAVGSWFHSPFFMAASLIGCVAQVPHYLAHHRIDSGVIRFLQNTGLIISPAHHAGHHNGKFDRNYCILSGWNNLWMNPLLGLCEWFCGPSVEDD